LNLKGSFKDSTEDEDVLKIIKDVDDVDDVSHNTQPIIK